MTRYRRPNPVLALQGVELKHLVGAIIRRMSQESGEHEYQCARDLHAAIEDWLKPGILLDQVLGGGLTYKKLGEQLGISAQAAHKRYGPRRKPKSDDGA
jgi:hypothetical protein